MITWTSEHRRVAICCLVLFLLTFVLFSSSLENEFLIYGDVSVTANELIRKGPSWEAFYEFHGTEWRPVTTLSHQFDYAMFGLNPMGHRAVNLLWHSANAALCLFLAWRLCGSLMAAAAIAALFAWHPLRVESVVWVAERGGLLCTFFWLLTLQAYWSWSADRSRGRYALTLGLSALAAMSDSMAVTLPLTLLLLDFWPLQRISPHGADAWKVELNRLIVEKVPFFMVTVIFVLLPLSNHSRPEGLLSYDEFTMSNRLINGVAACGRYFLEIFFPAKLSFFYSQMPGTSLVTALVSAAGFGALLFIAWKKRGTLPEVLFGCLWYLLLILPAGIMQTDRQAMADHAGYLASFGLVFALLATLIRVTSGGSLAALARPVQVMTMAAALLCAALTHAQIPKWRNDETMLRHTLSVTENNYLAHALLGDVLASRGDLTEAVEHYQASAKSRPAASLHYKAGKILLAQGKPALAAQELKEALNIQETHAEAHFELALALTDLNRLDEGAKHLNIALSLNARIKERIYIPPEPVTNPAPKIPVRNTNTLLLQTK